jgi:hypothetical protein
MSRMPGRGPVMTSRTEKWSHGDRVPGATA